MVALMLEARMPGLLQASRLVALSIVPPSHSTSFSFSSLFPPYPLLPPTTACSRFRCWTMEVTRQTQMTSVAAAARQHPDLKLFSVRLPWRQCLLLFSRHGRQLARQLLPSPPSPASRPPLLWAHLQRVADPRSRRHMQRCRTRAQRESSFHPWRLSCSAYKVLHCNDTVKDRRCACFSMTGLPNNTYIAFVKCFS